MIDHTQGSPISVEWLQQLSNQFFHEVAGSELGQTLPQSAVPTVPADATATAFTFPPPLMSEAGLHGTGIPAHGIPVTSMPSNLQTAPGIPPTTSILETSTPPEMKPELGRGWPPVPNSPIIPSLPGLSSVDAQHFGINELPISETSASRPWHATEPSFYFLTEFASPPFVSNQPLTLGGFNPELLAIPQLSAMEFDVDAIRSDFPTLQERVHGRQLIWLDNAATTQKSKRVIDRLSQFYSHENSNVHRAAHELAARATDAYEGAREKVARFLNASGSNEIVFVRGTTEAINLVAKSWGRQNVGKDDEILITWLEHHANIVPWQQLASETGAVLRVVPVDNTGQILLDEYQRLLNPKTKLVSFAHVSNALGTITPVRQMIEMARRYDVRVLVDGAQAVSHMPVNVQAMDCDWYVFSGHKMFAPTGIGALYGKADLLEASPPWQGGGNMIKDVTFEKTLYHSAPARFEAGTGNIADAVGLGAAIDYLQRIGMERIANYEHDLLEYGTRVLQSVPGLRLIGTAAEKAGVLSFVIDGLKTEEIGQALNSEGIAVRSGHHCAQPILRRFGLETTVRPSLALYNTRAELDELGRVLHSLPVTRNRAAQ